jgi:hypothetical protein
MNILAWVLQAMLAFYYLLYGIVLVIPPAHMKRMFADIPFSLRVVVAVFAAVALSCWCYQGSLRVLIE